QGHEDARRGVPCTDSACALGDGRVSSDRASPGPCRADDARTPASGRPGRTSIRPSAASLAEHGPMGEAGDGQGRAAPQRQSEGCVGDHRRRAAFLVGGWRLMSDLRRPEFATNTDDATVADALNGHLRWVLKTWAKPFEVGIATAYFNPGGFGLLADTLEEVEKVRLLLGAEPKGRERDLRHLDRATPPQRAERARVRNALATHARDLRFDRDLLGFEIEAEGSARRLIEWLRSGRVEVRRYEEGFLHGKAFLVLTDDEGVVAGSSNFTYAGLAKNLELNLGHYQPHVVRQVREW